MRYPNTVDRNIYLAYIRKEDTMTTAKGNESQQMRHLDAINLNWDLNYPETLVELSIKTIAENWGSKLKNIKFHFLNLMRHFLLKLFHFFAE